MKITLFLGTESIPYIVPTSSLDFQAFPVFLKLETNNHRIKDTRLEEWETVRGRRRQQADLSVEAFCRAVQEAVLQR